MRVLVRYVGVDTAIRRFGLWHVGTNLTFLRIQRITDARWQLNVGLGALDYQNGRIFHGQLICQFVSEGAREGSGGNWSSGPATIKHMEQQFFCITCLRVDALLETRRMSMRQQLNCVERAGWTWCPG
jgi:hypothetical protein